MSEEEKKAIENTEQILKEWQKIVDIEDDIERDCEMNMYSEDMPFFEMKTLLKLVKKQQKELEQVKKFGIPIETLCAEFERLENLEDKTDELKMELEDKQKEIERLKFDSHMVGKWNEYLDKNCISKDKIKEKIKHYNNELEHIKNGEEFEDEEPMYYWGKVALENLLEGN